MDELIEVLFEEVRNLKGRGRYISLFPLVDMYDNLSGDITLSTMRDYLYFNDLYTVQGVDFEQRNLRYKI